MKKPADNPIYHDLVLLGGGHSHVQVIRAFAMRPLSGLRVTLISDDYYAPYSGMLPGLLANWYTYDESHFDLWRLSQKAGVRFVCAKALKVDTHKKVIELEGRAPIGFDTLSINMGITPHIGGVSGKNQSNFIPLKPIGKLLERWKAYQKDIEQKVGLRVGVVGGGAGGAEVAMVLALGLGNKGKVTLFQRGDHLLRGHSFKAQKSFKADLQKHGVEVATGVEVQDFDGQILKTSQKNIPLDYVFWATEAAPPPLIKVSGLHNDSGFLKVGATLQNPSHPFIFGAGDCISIEGYELPKSGVFAVRQGPVLSENLRRFILGQKNLKKYVPQKKTLALITSGHKKALASYGAVAFSGSSFWWKVKDFIDRRFMRKFQHLPPMKGEFFGKVPERPKKITPNTCGGCGAKVEKGVLTSVFQRLDQEGLMKTGSLDDAAVLNPTNQKQLATIDGLKQFIDDPYLFAQIAAYHSLSDVYAMGGTPSSVLTLVTLVPGKKEKVEEDLYQMMRGILSALDSATQLVGGHTMEGAEATLALSCLGSIGEPKYKGSLGVGDDLIITKALGSGVLLRANMHGVLKGVWGKSLMEHLCLSNRVASQMCEEFEIGGMTDITGFGLAGHLREMLGTSRLGIEIDLSNLPILEGYKELSPTYKSYLCEKNKEAIEFDIDGPPIPAESILFDPQTNGGVVLTVTPENTNEVVSKLHSMGYLAAQKIGRVIPSKVGPRIFLK